VLSDFHREKDQFNAKLRDLKDKLATLSLSPQRDDKYDVVRNGDNTRPPVMGMGQPNAQAISPRGDDGEFTNRESSDYGGAYQSNFAKRQ
jgi:hypothetical protein